MAAAAELIVESISVLENATWQVNRPIVMRFSKPINFASVSLNSINIRAVGGANALGEFYLQDPNTVVFQPVCPTTNDLTNLGLEPGGVAYELTLIGHDQQLGFSVEALDGSRLERSVRRSFQTPTSLEPAELFFDPVLGAPVPRIRGRNASEDELAATHIQLGGEGALSERLYYHDVDGQIELQNAAGEAVELPLNLYSQTGSQVALMLFLNQPVDPGAGTDSSGQASVYFEFESTPDNWLALPTTSELLANCTSTGAVLRVEPVGLLAPGALVRVALTSQFVDLVGEAHATPLSDFAIARVADVGALGVRDELLESFDLSATDDPALSLEDFGASLADPLASWGGGQLAPAFDFNGNGGPQGSFDVVVRAGEVATWNTTSQQLTGGPGFVPTDQTVAFAGRFDVRNLLVESGGTLRFIGPNPVEILATGDVTIDGLVQVNGVNRLGVAQINLASVPETGASGQCGGGQGGTGSPLGNAHSVRGGSGFGPGGVPGGGGRGGEAGWAANNVIAAARRGSGGGGGVLGANQQSSTPGLVDERFIGLNAERGFDGPTAFDALGNLIGAFSAENPESMMSPPVGGEVGLSPFVDGDPSNNFFGKRVDSITGSVIVGELTQARPGSGGGAGGDASEVIPGTVFPAPFVAAGDEKGGGGGGGAGAITVLALGKIRFGAGGQLQCRGGHGGAGESTGGVNRIGGGGGGGSGGHVILQSASAIDFSAKTSGLAGLPAILATGGQGAAGAGNAGGATAAGELAVDLDACHANSAPFDSDCDTGEVLGAGGDGGPGLIQLHTPLGVIGSAGDIVVPGLAVGLADLCFPTPVPPLVPRFGRLSRARSVWIRLGEGGFNPLDPSAPAAPSFSFAGTDPATGSILINGNQVVALPELLGVQLLQSPSVGLPFVAADGRTLVLSDVGFAPEFLVNPELLRGYWIDLDAVGSVGSNTARFQVADAVHDGAAGQLALTVSLAGNSLAAAALPGQSEVRVRPTFFRVQSANAVDQIPDNVDIRIFFEAAPELVTGAPDLANASGMRTDIASLNAGASNGAPYQFLRFEVLFDVDKQAAGFQVNPPDARLDFLRLPFAYR